MSAKQKYTQKLLLALIGAKKELQTSTLSAVYEMGIEGDFRRTGDKKIDRILDTLLEDDEMPDIVGEIVELLEKKIKTHLT